MSVPDGNRPGYGTGGYQPPPGVPAAGVAGYPGEQGYPGARAYPSVQPDRSGPGQQAGAARPPGSSPAGYEGPVCTAFSVPSEEPAVPPRRGQAGPARLLGLGVAVLGVLNFCFGFLPEVVAPRLDQTLSVFAVGPAYVPTLLLIAGLLALAAFLPGNEHSRLAVAAVSVGGAVGAIVSLGTPGSFELFANPNQVTAGMGAILLVVFGIVQAVVAIAGYVIGPGASNTGRPSAAAPSYGFIGSAGYSTAAAAYRGQSAGAGSTPTGYSGTVSGYSGYGYSAAGQSAAPATNSGAAQSAFWTPAAPGPGAAGGPASGWVPVSQRPGPWQPGDEPATGPQVVVGTESGRADQPSRTGDSLASRDTGPIPVVAQAPPASPSPAPAADGSAPDPAIGETVVVTAPKSEQNS